MLTFLDLNFKRGICIYKNKSDEIPSSLVLISLLSLILLRDENAFIAIPTQRLTLIPKTYVDILKYISIYN